MGPVDTLIFGFDCGDKLINWYDHKWLTLYYFLWGGKKRGSIEISLGLYN
jgi:hypothetical protein